ncbi:hypothetical protein GGR57DRAFT_138426 [Xylariaceae sp. FL1272]|nr:hypothetical protein GGR57DRAFT_138426 [Xylariaceae sp. FL1272]
MSSMFKKGGGLSFKPKAGRRAGAAPRPAATSSASASTTPAPTATPTPIPAAEPTQPQPDFQPESQEPTPNPTTSDQPPSAATKPIETISVNPVEPASSEPSSATQAQPTLPESSAASPTRESTSQADQSIPISSVPSSGEPAKQPSPIVQQRTPLPTQQASHARRTPADIGPPTPAPGSPNQDTRPASSIEGQNGINILGAPTAEASEAPVQSSCVLESDANANASTTTPSAEEPPVARRPLPKKPAPKKRKPAATSGEAEPEGPAPKKTRQRKPRAAATDDTEEGTSTDAQPAKKRKPRAPRAAAESGEGASTESRPEKQRRKRPVTPEDAENQKVDHTTMTVGELVKDLGIGKPFKHAEEIQQRAREARAANKLKRLERQKIRAGIMPAPQNSADKEGTADREARGAAMAEIGAAMDTGSTSQGVGYDVIDGQIVVSQASLVVNRHNQDVSTYEEVEENEFTTVVTSNSFRKKPRGVGGWSDDETEKFYRLLGQFGIDFEAISNFFPLKSRDQCRRKFIKEERARPNRVNAAIMVRGEKKTEINIEEYKATQLEWFSKDNIEAEQNKLAEEHGKEIERLKEERRAAGLMDDNDENTAQEPGKNGPEQENEDDEFEEEDADAMGLNGGVEQSVETF